MRLALQLLLAWSLAFIGIFIVQHYGPTPEGPWVLYGAIGLVAGCVAALIV